MAGRNTAQAGQRWSRRGPKPEPVAPSWETLGMEPGGPSDDGVCQTERCRAVRSGDVTLHAHRYRQSADRWVVVLDDGDEVWTWHYRTEAAAFTACAYLLALPPTNKENA